MFFETHLISFTVPFHAFQAEDYDHIFFNHFLETRSMSFTVPSIQAEDYVGDLSALLGHLRHSQRADWTLEDPLAAADYGKLLANKVMIC